MIIVLPARPEALLAAREVPLSVTLRAFPERSGVASSSHTPHSTQQEDEAVLNCGERCLNLHVLGVKRVSRRSRDGHR
ncbi:hypothetical protein RRG08_062302 [Elysia crispata]|uniref:Uncharacterized protein n=1 Tax=Elysia crispata TaxID=231223 RepID=A0AAE0YGN6_9GAST|nr:hypothetical protein RRG08_062302 [Elysia crispata]